MRLPNNRRSKNIASDHDSSQTIHPTDKALMQCGQCPRLFKKPTHYRNHVMNKHNEASCRFCRKVFKGHATLDYHVKAQHPETIKGIEERQCECYACHKSFKSMSLLRTHLYSHSRAKKYLCTQCGYFAITPRGLDTHMMRNDHNLTGEVIKPHRCEICAQAFATRHVLDIHRTTHSDVRNYPCPICGKSFKNQKNLGQHKVTHGEKKHCCHLCEYRCYTAGNLKLHMKVHTGRN